MARIFISHSRTDNPQVAALADWLRGEGLDDLFIDWDPNRGLVAGDRWEQALLRATERCDLVICLVSQAWLDSEWCRGEFRLASRLNKRIMALLLEDIPNHKLPRELADNWQLVNLVGGMDHDYFIGRMPDGSQERPVTFSRAALTRLKNGLHNAVPDPRCFDWPPANDPGRPPYRGMRPLEAEDAGIFFGRDASIIELLRWLRALRRAAPPRLLVILGASGTGKSSFLRAGILPRLQRDEKNFLPLPVIRPESGVLSGESGLLPSLEKAFAQQGIPISRKALREELAGGGAGAILTRLVAQARDTNAGGEEPAVVLSIDQGEELFLGEGVEESRPFLALLKDLLTADSPALIALVTIRSDAYERLQTAKELKEIPQKTFSLPPMPNGSYLMVIEGPAARLDSSSRAALFIEPQLTQSLLLDIEKGGGKGALPLLAFTLERLYVEYGGEGALKAAHYREMGAMGGVIEAAAADALACAEKDSRQPRDAVHRLLRQAFVPWLAGMDPDSKTPRRRVARQEDIPPASLPLLHCFVEQRLLATDVDQDGAPTIEPAHEALLHQWGLLHGWLQEDAALLVLLDGVQRAAREWQAQGGDDGAWLVHSSSRLEEAEGLRAREDLARFLSQTDWDYLQGCRAQEDRRRKKELGDAQALSFFLEPTADNEFLDPPQRKFTPGRDDTGLPVAALPPKKEPLDPERLRPWESRPAEQGEPLEKVALIVGDGVGEGHWPRMDSDAFPWPLPGHGSPPVTDPRTGHPIRFNGVWWSELVDPTDAPSFTQLAEADLAIFLLRPGDGKTLHALAFRDAVRHESILVVREDADLRGLPRRPAGGVTFAVPSHRELPDFWQRLRDNIVLLLEAPSPPPPALRSRLLPQHFFEEYETHHPSVVLRVKKRPILNVHEGFIFRFEGETAALEGEPLLVQANQAFLALFGSTLSDPLAGQPLSRLWQRLWQRAAADDRARFLECIDDWNQAIRQSATQGPIFQPQALLPWGDEYKGEGMRPLIVAKHWTLNDIPIADGVHRDLFLIVTFQRMPLKGARRPDLGTLLILSRGKHETVNKVVALLESLGFSCRWDLRDLQPGDAIEGTFAQWCRNADAAIIFVDGHFSTSHGPRQALEAISNINDRLRLLPVVLPPATPAHLAGPLAHLQSLSGIEDPHHIAYEILKAVNADKKRPPAQEGEKQP